MRGRPSRPSSLFLVLSVLLFVSVAGTTALAAGALPLGTYANEGYTLTFDASGHFRYLKGERMLVEGLYRAKDDTVSFTDVRGVDACQGQDRETGSYRWTSHDEHLSFAKIQDSCNERIRGLAGRWKRQEPKK